MGADSVSELPTNWKFVKIKDISRIIHYGYTASSNPSPVGPKMLRITDIQNDRVDWNKVPFCKINNDDIEKYRLKNGDIVFARTGATVGKSFLINGSIPDSVFASYLIRIILYHRLLSKYVYYFFKTSNYWKQISQSSAGIGQPNVNATKLSNIEIPLPPLPEQHRIVAKIEELFTKLDAGVEALRKAKALLKQYRQSVLKAAVEGKLTEEWRKEHAGEIEPASVLLERIQAERKARLGSKYKPPKPIDTSKLPELPEGWGWANIEDVGANERNAIVDGPFGSNLKVVHYDPNGQIPVVSITNIDEGYNDRNLRYINHNKFNEIKRSAIKPGDILMAKIGSSYGKCGYYPDNMPIGIIPANMLKVTVNCSVNKSYLFHYFKSLSFKRRLDKIMKSTAQPAFNVTTFKNIAVPLPPKIEQDIIVMELSRLISLIDESDQIIDAELKRSQSLRQSILKRAFEGKLVPQDPADPPASELLERIRKEKESV